MIKTLYHMATRGNLYSIAFQKCADGTFMIKEYKHGREQGCASLGSLCEMSSIAEYNTRIDNAAKYDQIYYVKAVK